MSDKRRTFAVIDGNSLMHRAFHAVPPTMNAPDGRPTNAIFGFLNMFLKMIDAFNPDGVVVAFDKGKPRVRMEMLPQYKAQRPPMDPDLHAQFPMIKDLLAALNVPILQSEGWEGDDILGTMARLGEQAGCDMLLVTGDRDMYQLVTEHVNVVSTRKGLSDVAIMTPESVDDLYHGITPALVPDFYGLKGDTSDNIPGVPGIGPKKASALIAQYGSLDEVIAHPAVLRAAAGDADALGAVAAEVSRAIDAGEWVAAVVDDDKEEGALFGLTRTLWLATSKGLFALEEGDGGAAAEVEGFNFAHGVIAGVLARLFMEGRVASPDMKTLLHELSPVDSSEPELMDPLSADSTRIFDTVVAAYLLDSDRSEFDEAYLADTYLQMALPAARGAEGAGEDAPAPAARTAALTLALVAQLREFMARENAANVFDGIEMPLVPVLAKMERAGMLVDSDRLHSLSEGLATQISEVERSIRDLAGDETFNIGSPMQLSHVLFDVMGLPTKGLKKTKRGYYSTNAKVLSDLARDHEIVRLILDWREKSKIKSTYLDTLGPLRRGDGRVHTTYNQTITATGRLSSSDPNLQNIPTRSELGRTVKTAFSAGEGSVFLAVDYSQIELRLLAHLSGDEHLVRAFNEGEDFHAETAARVFGVPVSEVTPDLRSRAKAVNFGIVYGQQAYGLSQSLHISMAEARDMIDRYYEAYPGVRKFLDNVVARAKQTGYAETMYGRRRHIPELKAKNPQLRGFGERTAMNHPMQGTAADIIKIAMARVSRRLEEEGFAAHMILQVHDELDFECPVNEVERLTTMVRDAMEHVVDLRVPLIAEASTGVTWADAK